MVSAGYAAQIQTRFTATDETSRVVDGLKDKMHAYTQEVKALQHTAESASQTVDTLARTAAGLFSVEMARRFTNQIIQTRGEFQKLEIAFTTLLGSEAKASKMMDDAVKMAAKTPFDLQGVAAGAKQLLAYGANADTVIDTLRSLGDVAAGMSLPLNRVVAIYGQVMAQGKLTGLTLKRFMMAGIPVVEELSKSMGKSTKQIQEMVSAGKIGFPEIEKLFKRMTSEGGKFDNLMERQSKTITGRISNIEDAISQMFNEIGEKTEGPINTALDAVQSLIDNYEKVGAVLAGAAAAFGIYRTAIVAVNAANKIASLNALGYTKDVLGLIAADKGATASHLVRKAALMGVSEASIESALATDNATAALVRNIAAEKGARAAVNANVAAQIASKGIYVAIAAAVVAAGVAIYKYKTHLSAAEKAEKDLHASQATIIQETGKERAELDRLSGVLEGAEKGTKAWKMAKDEAVAKFGQYYKNLGDEIDRTGTLASSYDAIATSLIKAARARQYYSYVEKNQSALDTEATKNLDNVRGAFFKGEGGFFQKGSGAAGMVSERLGRTITDKDVEKAWSEVVNYVYEGTAMSESTQAILEAANQNRKGFRTLEKVVEEAHADMKAQGDIIQKAKAYFQVTDEDLAALNGGGGGGGNKPSGDDGGYALQKVKERAALERERSAQDKKFVLEQEQINRMADGYAKDELQSLLDYNKRLEEIKREREDELQKLVDTDKSIWMKAGEKRKEKDYTVGAGGTNLTVDEGYYERLAYEATAAYEKAANERFTTYLAELGDKNAQVLKAEEQLNSQIAALDKVAADEQAAAGLRADAEYLAARLRLVKDARITEMEYENLSESASLEERLKKYKEMLAAQAALEKAQTKRKGESAEERGKRERQIDLNTAAKEAAYAYEQVAEFGSADVVLEKFVAMMRAKIAAAPEEFVPAMEESMEAELARLFQDLAARGDNEEMQDWLDTLGKQTYKGMKEALEELKKGLEGVDKEANPQLWAELAAKIKIVEDAIREVDRENKRGKVNWKEIGDIINGVADSFDALGETVGGVAGEMLSSFGDIATAAVGVANGLSVIEEGAKGVERATAILAVISAAMRVVSKVVSVVKQNREANEAATRSAQEYAKSLAEINAEYERHNRYSTAFGEDEANIFRANTAAARDYLASLQNLSSQLGGISSDSRSWWQKLWGTKKENIVKLTASDYTNADGSFNGDKLRAWYEKYGSALEEEQKLLIEGMLSDWDNYVSGVEDSMSYLTDILNDVAQNAAEALVDKFIESGDALADMTDLANDFARSMAVAAVKSMLIEKVFTPKAQQEISDLLAEGDTGGAIAKYNELLEDANAMSGEINNFLQGINYQDMLATDEQGSRKGIATASQESVDENNGRLTAIQGHTYEINENVKALNTSFAFLLDHCGNILIEVRGIHDDTQAILKETHATRLNTDTIITKGVRAL